MTTKYRCFSTIEKEEQWLNSQIEQGRKLVGPIKNGVYHFIDQPSFSKVIRIDSRKFDDKNAHRAYIQFMKDAGWKHLAGQKYSGKHYFEGDRDQSDELFSDNHSKYEREVRARNALIGLNFMSLIVCMFIFSNTRNRMILSNPKAAFLTPNLWVKEGDVFTKAFLFELPLAVIRIGVSLIPILLIIFFIYQLVIVQRSINKFKQND